eukprot:4671822-Amphidinium_carterae.1
MQSSQGCKGLQNITAAKEWSWLIAGTANDMALLAVQKGHRRPKGRRRDLEERAQLAFIPLH